MSAGFVQNSPDGAAGKENRIQNQNENPSDKSQTLRLSWYVLCTLLYDADSNVRIKLLCQEIRGFPAHRDCLAEARSNCKVAGGLRIYWKQVNLCQRKHNKTKQDSSCQHAGYKVQRSATLYPGGP